MVYVYTWACMYTTCLAFFFVVVVFNNHWSMLYGHCTQRKKNIEATVKKSVLRKTTQEVLRLFVFNFIIKSFFYFSLMKEL